MPTSQRHLVGDAVHGTGVSPETTAVPPFPDDQARQKRSSTAEDGTARSSRAARTTHVTCSIRPIACSLLAPSRPRTRTFHWLRKPGSVPMAELARRGGAGHSHCARAFCLPTWKAGPAGESEKQPLTSSWQSWRTRRLRVGRRCLRTTRMMRRHCPIPRLWMCSKKVSPWWCKIRCSATSRSRCGTGL